MGLFRRRRRQKHGKAEAELPETETRTAPGQSAGTRREVAAEQRPDPDQPGWGRAIGGEIGRTRQNRPSQD